jgi:hypothetical protein
MRDAIGKHQSDVDFGVGAQKVLQYRQDMQPTEQGRSRHRKVSFGCGVFTGSGAFCLVHQLQDGFGGRNEGKACWRRRKSLRRSPQ